MFGIDDLFLVSMMAAGAVTSLQQNKQQMKLIKTGRNLENAAFETNMAALQAETAQSSLESIQALRQNVAAQIVMNAARGNASGGGSGASAINASNASFTADEKTRRLNLLSKEANLRANNVLSGLHTLQSETQLGQSLSNSIFNNAPATSLIEKFKPGEFLTKGIKKTFGFGLTPEGT